MASVKTTIAMQDKMTPVLRTIIKSMEQTVTAMASMDNASDKALTGAKKGIQDANRALMEFNSQTENTTPIAKEAENTFGKWKQRIMASAAAIYTVQKAIAGLSGMVKIADEFALTMARLDLMNDGLQETSRLQDMIMASAERSRASYGATADAVGKLGLLAKEAFESTAEIVAFSELVNKSFKVGGASAQEQASAMYQLTQAMSSGRLQGDEFTSIMENAPMIAQAIADFTGKSKGDLKEMSSQGLITADIIKGAMFAAADDIENKFDAMPLTFSDAVTSIKNQSLEIFQPLLEQANAVANDPSFQAIVMNVVKAISWMATGIMTVMDWVNQAITWVSENGELVTAILIALGATLLAYYIPQIVAAMLATWSLVAAKIALAWSFMLAHWWLLVLFAAVLIAIWAWQNLGTAGQILATIILIVVALIAAWIVVQWALNAALAANPIGVVIMAIAALIIIIALVILWLINLWETNLDFKYGVIAIWRGIQKFFDKIPMFFMGIGHGIAGAFDWAKLQVLKIMEGMANGAIDIMNKLISALNKIPGVNIAAIDKVNFTAQQEAVNEANRQAREAAMSNAESEAAAKAAAREAEDAANRAADQAKLDAKRAEAEAAAKAAENQQSYSDIPGLEGLADFADGFDYSQFEIDPSMMPGMAAIDAMGGTGGAGATPKNPTGGKLDSIGKINDDITIDEDDLKYLKDIAQVEFINQYTTLRPEMTVTFGDVTETADVGQIVAVIEEMVENAYASSLVGA